MWVRRLVGSVMTLGGLGLALSLTVLIYAEAGPAAAAMMRLGEVGMLVLSLAAAGAIFGGLWLASPRQ